MSNGSISEGVKSFNDLKTTGVLYVEDLTTVPELITTLEEMCKNVSEENLPFFARMFDGWLRINNVDTTTKFVQLVKLSGFEAGWAYVKSLKNSSKAEKAAATRESKLIAQIEVLKAKKLITETENASPDQENVTEDVQEA